MTVIFTSAENVFYWLREQTGDNPFHLRLLNVRYEPEDIGQIVDIYSELAKRLRSQPALIHELLRGEFGGWRSTLVGNVVVILQRTSEFEDDLVSEIIRGNWVAPQIAAGFALTTQGNGIQRLLEFLDRGNKPTRSDHVYPKDIVSAYTALKLIGHEKADAFEGSLAFETAKSKGADYWIKLTYKHHTFWKVVPPVD